MSDEGKITLDEFNKMFPQGIPAEAFALVWHDAPADMTISEVRAKLKEMAENKPAAMTPDEIARVLVERLRHEDWDTDGRLPDYWNSEELIPAITVALRAAEARGEARGYAQAREQAAGVVDSFRTGDNLASKVLAAAIRAMHQKEDKP